MPFLYPKPLQSPHLETFFQFSERWNLITSWFFLAVHLHNKASKLTRQSRPQEKAEVGKPFTSSAGAEPRKIFVESCDLTAFGIVSTLANCTGLTLQEQLPPGDRTDYLSKQAIKYLFFCLRRSHNNPELIDGDH